MAWACRTTVAVSGLWWFWKMFGLLARPGQGVMWGEGGTCVFFNEKFLDAKQSLN